MSEEEIKSAITSFREAVSSSDVEKVLSLFADDAVLSAEGAVPDFVLPAELDHNDTLTCRKKKV